MTKRPGDGDARLLLERCGASNGVGAGRSLTQIDTNGTVVNLVRHFEKVCEGEKKGKEEGIRSERRRRVKGGRELLLVSKGIDRNG